MKERHMSVTVKDLDDLLAQVAKLEGEADAIDDLMKAKNKKINTLLWRAAAYCEELGRTEYATPHGVFEIVDEERVKLPVEDLDKKAFFQHLRDREILDKYATVNAASFKALFFADRRAFVSGGGDPMLFRMPGIGPVMFDKKPNFKIKKKRKEKVSGD